MVNRALIGSPLAAVRLGQGRSRRVRRGEACFLGPWRLLSHPHARAAAGKGHRGQMAIMASAESLAAPPAAAIMAVEGCDFLESSPLSSSAKQL